MKKITEAKQYLKENKLDGWLLYDFHGKNDLARQFLELSDEQMTTRRFFYWIPVEGEPVKLVHAIEANVLDAFDGEKRIYSSWEALESQVEKLLKGSKKVAMEYSPKNAIPYVSLVDGGTIDLVRSFGVEVLSSAVFIPHFTAVLNEEEKKSQKRAAKHLETIVANAWSWIAEHLSNNQQISEYDVQQKILSDFKKLHLITDHAPIAAVNAHSADPHYEPQKERSSQIQKGDFILIDLWAKEEGGIFADITRVGVAAKAPSAKQNEIFQIVKQARDAAVSLVRGRFKEGRKVEGWEVDRAARDVIEEAGFGKYFIHRTGHSIERSLHGSGAHMDDLEMHDVRPILPSTCFSVEPGIYLPGEFGVRLEFDVLVHTNGELEITGGSQNEITPLF